MTTCIESRNQPIYQRLMDRAAREKHKTDQYKQVAQALITYDSDLFWCFDNIGEDTPHFITQDNPLDGCTIEIAHYIYQLLQALSSKDTCTNCGTVPRCYCEYP